MPVLIILANAAGMPRGTVGAVVAAALAGGGIALVLSRWRAIRETTLVSAAIWAAAALAGLGLAEVAFQWSPAGFAAISAWRYLATTLTFCPVVSVLGSKRPQHLPWNFVVLSLWGITALPAVQALALGRGEAFLQADLRGWLLWLLIALSIVNYLPTRHAWSAVLVALGQVVLLAPHLPLIGRQLLNSDPGLVALGCFLAAAVVVVTTPPRRAVKTPYDRLWLDFRDAFGLFWSLRVQERVNAAARMYAWSFYLAWSGFRGQDDQPLQSVPTGQEKALRQTLRGLLRRFVSSAWIATRLGRGVD